MNIFYLDGVKLHDQRHLNVGFPHWWCLSQLKIDTATIFIQIIFKPSVIMCKWDCSGSLIMIAGNRKYVKLSNCDQWEDTHFWIGNRLKKVQISKWCCIKRNQITNYYAFILGISYPFPKLWHVSDFYILISYISKLRACLEFCCESNWITHWLQLQPQINAIL